MNNVREKFQDMAQVVHPVSLTKSCKQCLEHF